MVIIKNQLLNQYTTYNYPLLTRQTEFHAELYGVFSSFLHQFTYDILLFCCLWYEPNYRVYGDSSTHHFEWPLILGETSSSEYSCHRVHSYWSVGRVLWRDSIFGRIHRHHNQSPAWRRRNSNGKGNRVMDNVHVSLLNITLGFPIRTPGIA